MRAHLNVITSLETGHFEVGCGSFWKVNYQQAVWQFSVFVHHQYVSVVSLNGLNNYLLDIDALSQPYLRIWNTLAQFSHEEVRLQRRLVRRCYEDFWSDSAIKV